MPISSGPPRSRTVRSVRVLVQRLGGARMVAIELGITPHAVRRWIKTGKVPLTHEIAVLRKATRLGINWQPARWDEEIRLAFDRDRGLAARAG